MYLGRRQFDETWARPDASDTAKLMGLLPWRIGMEMILVESLLPPRYVRGAACKAVGIELRPDEPSIEGRESIATQGCVLLRYMPKCIYVQVEDSTQTFLQASSPGAPPPGVADLRGVLAITPATRSWQLVPSSSGARVQVARTQIPFLPRKQCALRGI